jgi:cation:H+ antiporter
MLISIVFLVGGLIMLFYGAQWLLRSSLSLAGYFGISSLITGLTVVAFGTSAPELATSMISAYQGRGDIALGNVVGSNIVNIGLILGLTALFVPIGVSTTLNNRYIPFLIGTSLILAWFSWSLDLSRVEGLVFLGLFGLFMWYAVAAARSDKRSGASDEAAGDSGGATKKKPRLALSIMLIVISLALLYFGADFFVRGAVDIARLVGLSEAIIGVTIVALGTSMPELAASMLAAARRLPGVALGNIVGSNLFNVMVVVGVPASLFPFAISPAIAQVSIPVMLGFTVLLMIFALTGRRVSRREGFSLLVATGIYWAGLLIFT